MQGTYFDSIFTNDFSYWGRSFLERYKRPEEEMTALWVQIKDVLNLSKREYDVIYFND